MSLVKEWKRRGELPEYYPEPPSRLERLRATASRARAAIERRRAAIEEKAVRRVEVGAESRAARAGRESGLSARREAAMARRREAELGLGTQRGRELTELGESRAAKRGRILAERKLRKEKLRPYREVGAGAVRVGRGVGRGLIGAGKGAFTLGERLTRPPATRPKRVVRREPEEELLDFGFDEEPGAPRRRRKAESLDLGIDLGEIKID